MHRHVIAALVAASLAAGASAQSAHGSHNPALKHPTAHDVAAPAKGRNSFTEAQARGRLEKAGFSGVSALTKDRNGVWQGTAIKNGAKATVMLDYKGNITTR
ncbi:MULTISPECIES: hypothetical protein [Sphingomonas]|jgi:hypothetical protein|uniref:hypothetical protein n=1 Tax=Sphingomonas TaxID=13687 RepID=UPI001AEF108B|nr:MULTISPECIES: hypothetical protein [Sphingomonas]